MPFIKGHKINIGRKYSKKTLKKMSDSQIGKSPRGYGWHHSISTKRKIRIAKTIHGHSSRLLKNRATPIYAVWVTMHARCKSKKRKNYGGRGIKVCKRWKNFTNFLEDMGERPNGKSIDRINNNGNYNPKNCKWSTPKEQANNRRKRKLCA